VRIISGAFKGRQLAGPTGPGLRPTSDSLRETLFNILGPRVRGTTMVDGFAGTGAVGLEALSRGAARVTFVELDRRAIKLWQDNIRLCGAGAQSEVISSDWQRGAATLSDRFDVVFLDPPYDVTDLEAIVRAGAPLLAPGGRLVLEHSRRRDSPAEVAPLQRIRLVLAGDSALSFYQ
jgi:16S rRNA (guanine(966)-N(2))-methyltransferase RsmD